MDRRTFNRFIGWSPMALAAWRIPFAGTESAGMIKPLRLKPGSRVGLIAPASPFPPERLAKAVRNLQDLELEVELGRNVMDEYGYLAGTDEARLDDLHEMFLRSDIDAVWCIRGGYGTSRLLPKIDYDLIRSNPKVFIGYSDITALHLALSHKAGLITFHGPVGSSTWTAYSRYYLQKQLFEGHEMLLSAAEVEHEIDQTVSRFTIRSGQAEGRLIGGNLTLLASLAGTEYLPSFVDKIVCIEEVGEEPYRIDRMLTQLLPATDLERAGAIVLGQFTDCEPENEERSLTMRETLELCLGDLECPISYGWNFGHIYDQFTLPIGLKARMNTEKSSIQLLESPVR